MLDDMTVSPLMNTERKGGTFPMMLQQSRRVIGVTIIRGNSNHTLRRKNAPCKKDNRRSNEHVQNKPQQVPTQTKPERRI